MTAVFGTGQAVKCNPNWDGTWHSSQTQILSLTGVQVAICEQQCLPSGLTEDETQHHMN